MFRFENAKFQTFTTLNSGATKWRGFFKSIHIILRDTYIYIYTHDVMMSYPTRSICPRPNVYSYRKFTCHACNIRISYNNMLIYENRAMTICRAMCLHDRRRSIRRDKWYKKKNEKKNVCVRSKHLNANIQNVRARFKIA